MLIAGWIQVKPDGDLLGEVYKYARFHVHDPITMGFDETGMKIILVDHFV